MMEVMRLVVALLFAALAAPAQDQDPNLSTSKRLRDDMDLTLDVNSPLWRLAPVIVADHSAKGTLTPGHRTEIRSRWSAENLYFLFVCPYEELYLLSDPRTDRETNKLWDHDVVEVFIGSDLDHTWLYREFQVSPQGEWVDLDIDRQNPKPAGGWLWNSGFTVKAQIDKDKKIWYAAMKIPFKSITTKAPKPGMQFKVDYFRLQGPPPDRKAIAWRPTSPTGNHHMPDKFGFLKLEN
jgi:hypothetical protein